MKLDLVTLAKIERQAKELAGSSDELKPVPDNWQEFSGLVKIRTKNGYKPFAPFEYQQDFVRLIEQCPMTVVAKTRQLGFSIAIVNWLIFKALSEPGIDSAIFSLNQQSTSQLAKQARSQLDSLDGVYCQVTSDSLTSISFSNGSNIYFRNSSIDATRGLTIKYAVFDEMGFISELEMLFGAVSPCLTIYGEDARVIGISTPNAASGMYFELLTQNNDFDVLQACEEIRSGTKNSFTWTDDNGTGKMLAHWRDNPNIQDKEGYLKRIANRFNLDEQTVQREYNLSFSSSAESVFSPTLIKEVCSGDMPKKRQKDSRVICGIDCNASSGGSADYFVAVFLEEYQGKIKLIDYYRNRGVTSDQHVYSLGAFFEKYKPDVVAVESNNSGNVYIEQLAKTYPSQNIESVFTSSTTKPTNIGRLHMAMESKVLQLPEDKALVSELLSFQRIGKKMEAVGKRATDDIIMALSVAMTESEFGEMPNPDLIKIQVSESPDYGYIAPLNIEDI